MKQYTPALLLNVSLNSLLKFSGRYLVNSGEFTTEVVIPVGDALRGTLTQLQLQLQLPQCLIL